jgi:parallel beta-helix repeat protein
MVMVLISGWGRSEEVSPPVQDQEILTHEEALASPGTTYYVSPTGSDSNPGTEAQPWRTIQKAADTLVAGDTVYIKAGTYQERVIPQNSGSAGNYIVYAAYPGHTVTIDGAGITLPEWWGGLFDVSEKSYIEISGLRIINAGPHLNNVGILVDESSHIIVEGNTTYNTTSSGIGVWGSDNIIIDHNEVELACNGGEQECITVAGTDTFEIKNNHVHHGGPGTNGGEGIDAKDGSSFGRIFQNHVHHVVRVGIYVDAWDKHTYNIEVFGNVVHDIPGNGFALASEMGGLLENIKLYNNVAYNNQWCGVHLHECCTDHRPVHDVKVINNTFYDNGWELWGGGILVENPDAQTVTATPTTTPTATPHKLYLPLILKDYAPSHSLKDARMSDTPYGPAVINFPSGVGVVYTILEYENMRETLLGVRTYDNVGNVLFEQMKRYNGSGVESVRIASETGVFADGRYVTNIYVGATYRGDYPFLAKTLLWTVGEEWQWPTATFTPEVPVVTATPDPDSSAPTNRHRPRRPPWPLRRCVPTLARRCESHRRRQTRQELVALHNLRFSS